MSNHLYIFVYRIKTYIQKFKIGKLFWNIVIPGEGELRKFGITGKFKNFLPIIALRM